MPRNSKFNRRELLAGAVGLGSALSGASASSQGKPLQEGGFNRHSAPSQLKITDMRAIRIASNYDYPIIRIDTNQGVYGLGEVRDAGNEGIALVLKPHLLGRNPLGIEPILEKIRKFAYHQRLGGGYSAVDMALHDIAGKVYGVPCWRLVGSKWRDRVRIYCDTTQSKNPVVFAARLAERKKMGFTFFKMDLGTQLVADIPGAVGYGGAATAKGLRLLCEYLEAVRDGIGWDAPLAADHFGMISVNDCIRYARAFEPYQLAWAEDMLQDLFHGKGEASLDDWRGYKAIKESTTTPQAMGEGLFGLEEGFQPFIDNYAVDIVHPDPLTSGAIRETKRISDYASIYGIKTAIHFAGSPVGCMACVHLVATIRDFIVMENHAVDIPWWDDLVTGVSKPIIQDGFIPVPDSPGLGVELDEEVCRQHLRVPGYFEPTPQFDKYIIDDFRRGGPYPHLDENGNLVNSP